ncbi:hypothetical protein AB0O47_39290 [Streptomyces noursei]|uniref:hypothetical protein n=1 Tax=Streptomyces noursei TaxID=1971 RepID=UPI00345108C6
MSPCGTTCRRLRGEGGIKVDSDCCDGCVISIDPATIPGCACTLTADPARPGIVITPGAGAGTYTLGLDPAQIPPPTPAVNPSATAARPSTAPGPVPAAADWDGNANIAFTTSFNLLGFTLDEGGTYLRTAEDGVYVINVTARIAGKPPEGTDWTPQRLGIDVFVDDDKPTSTRLTPAEYTAVLADVADTYTYVTRHAIKAGQSIGVALHHLADATWTFNESDVHLYVFRVSAVDLP